jgi:putative mRNA 3-end processing factor
MSLITFTDRGLYCKQADAYIDPWKPVSRALITHGHADHARYGHKKYLATHNAIPVIKHRLGDIHIRGINYGDSIDINGVKVSFHPAGHIIGSAQIRLEHKGEIWVISGDYKIEDDGISEPYENIPCTHFVSECTFGLPIFNWSPQQQVIDEINAWWQKNKEEGKTSILTAYSLGKAQRLIQSVNHEIGKIFTHGAIENTNQVLRGQGINLKDTHLITDDFTHKDYIGNLVITPPGALGSNWMKRFRNVSTASASGWMAMRGTRRRGSTDRGFVLSDHADWKGLNDAIQSCGAEKVFVTHGYTDIFSKWLKSHGVDGHVVSTEYEGDGAGN